MSELNNHNVVVLVSRQFIRLINVDQFISFKGPLIHRNIQFMIPQKQTPKAGVKSK